MDEDKPTWREKARKGSALEAFLQTVTETVTGSRKRHDFWDTQPVPKETDASPTCPDDEGALETKTVDQVQQTPYDLPADELYWVSVDVNDQMELSEVYTLLYDHYVADDGGTFRFDYSRCVWHELLTH